MWIFWVIIPLIAIFIIVRPIREWIEKHHKYWQALAAIGTVIVLYIGFRSINLTRELFTLQNQPYIGIRSLSERNYYHAERRKLAFKTKVCFYNSGNLPGEIHSVHFILHYRDVRIDTTYSIKRIIFPDDTSSFYIRFKEEFLNQFESEVFTKYEPKSGSNYVDNLKFEFDISYYCYQIKKSFSFRSVWKHLDDCDKYVQVD